MPTYQEHLDLYSRIDICLDTFPYNGTTTTCEALWMGIPVVTLASDRHASRVGLSILNTIGLPQLIAHNSEEYVQKTMRLASDIDKLKSLRSNLRTMMLTSPLTDAGSFVKHLEDCYRDKWRIWCTST